MPAKPPTRRVIRLADCTLGHVRVSEWLPVNTRDPGPTEARLAQQLLTLNRTALDAFGIDADIGYHGRELCLKLRTTTTVGAFPLLSPVTGRPEFGVVITPRFDWSGIGEALAHTGWKTLPSIPELPTMPYSEAGIPPWIISSIVLVRIEALLRSLSRQFRIVDADTASPKGQIRWSDYAENRLPSARFLDVPCSFPDLQSDARLLGAIHYVLKIHLISLEGERAGGTAVLSLLDLCHSLIRRVQQVAPRRPQPSELRNWIQRSPLGAPMGDAIAGMEWTLDERGLAGIGDMSGLPWMLHMEEFFESWVETIVSQIARIIGGRLTTGRERQTIVPLRWDPPFLGSQRYLLPDVVLTRPGHTIIFDAKYKEHWEELAQHGWSDIATDIRTAHRADLLQVLAYASVVPSDRVTCCLVYPCRPSTWERLEAQGRIWHRASLGSGDRTVDMVLVAVPIGTAPQAIAERLCPGLW